MRFRLALLTLVLLAASAARADLSDIRLQESESGGVLEIVFDDTPLAVTITPGADGASILFEGVDAAPFSLAPTRNDSVVRIEMSPIEGGVIVRLVAGETPWAGITGRLSSRGGLFEIAFADTGAADGGSLHNDNALEVPDAVLTIIPAATGEDAAEPDEPVFAIEPADAAAPGMETALETGIREDETPVAPPAPMSSGPGEAAALAEPVEPEPADVTLPGSPADLMAEDSAADPCAPTAAIVERDPWDLDALTAQARCLASHGEGAAARPLLERVLAFEPSRFEAAFMLADLTEDAGDRDAAAALFEQAADAAQTDGQAVAARARARALRTGSN